MDHNKPASGVVAATAQTIKRYGSLYKLCKLFKECQDGVKELMQCLKLCKLIFVNETSLLIAAIVGPKVAKLMVKDLNHDLWNDEAVEARMRRVLEDPGDSILKAARHIYDTLMGMEHKIQGLEVDTTATGTSLVPPTGRRRRKVLQGRFILTFSESYLAEYSELIGKATRDYRSLRSELQQNESRIPEACASTHRSQELQRIQATRSAANHVYEILAGACKLHTKHNAHFSLTPVYASSGGSVDVKFKLAYRQAIQRHDPKSSLIHWFVIESSISGTVSTIPRNLSLMPACNSDNVKKRAAAPVVTGGQQCARTHTKRVRFRSPSPSLCESSRKAHDLGQAKLIQPEDLTSSGEDFCTHLQACRQDDHGSGTCIGWLKDSSQSKHMVYKSSGPVAVATKGTSSVDTLSEILDPLLSDPASKQGLSVLQRLQLAKLLTEAMLNYHATPWLQTTWNSKDIVLYNYKPSRSPKAVARTPDIYVKVPVRQQRDDTGYTNACDSLAPIVHNVPLFRLGVMLMELAYEKPMEAMRHSFDVRNDHPHEVVNVHTVKRLSRELSTTLGPRFADIIRKCLYCRFGQGTDLQDLGLQDAVHRDIVCEIDRLATGLQQLNIAG